MNAHLFELNTDEILRYLGHHGQTLSADLMQQIETCKKAILETAAPKIMVRSFSISDDHSVPPELQPFFTGNDIKQHLSGCHTIYLMAATLGSAVDRLLTRTQIRNMADALIMDACASTAIEAVCDRATEELAAQAAENNSYLTSRFSPGYGDLPITLQKDFIRLLQADRHIGLTVTDSFLLMPRKSVTALLGATDQKPVKKERRCTDCNLYDTCQFRKNNTVCTRS